MELRELYPFVYALVFVGLLIGAGIIVLSSFATEVKTSTTVTNETVALASQAGTAANDDITSVTYFGNSTRHCTPNPACVNVTAAGAITANSSFSDGNYDVSYVYDADSTGTTSVNAVVTALAAIPSTWLPLIVTVMVLSIIMFLVIRSFGGGSVR